MKKNTKRVKLGEAPPEGKIPIGEFTDIEKPEWIQSYQKVIDQLAISG